MVAVSILRWQSALVLEESKGWSLRGGEDQVSLVRSSKAVILLSILKPCYWLKEAAPLAKVLQPQDKGCAGWHSKSNVAVCATFLAILVVVRA
jgi:hypothetical protein